MLLSLQLQRDPGVYCDLMLSVFFVPLCTDTVVSRSIQQQQASLNVDLCDRWCAECHGGGDTALTAVALQLGGCASESCRGNKSSWERRVDADAASAGM
jgi:hypothetical protein